jgi:hypothetical protein
MAAHQKPSMVQLREIPESSLPSLAKRELLYFQASIVLEIDLDWDLFVGKFGGSCFCGLGAGS